MAIPVLIILAVLWAAVLIPPVVRSRRASQGNALGDYTQRLGVLGNHSISHMGRISPRPRRHLHVVPPARNGATRRPVTAVRPPANGARNGSAAPRRATATSVAQRRRRDVLLVLAGAALFSLLLLVVVRSPMVLGLQVVVDVLLGSYVYLLIRFRHPRPRRAATTTTYATTPVAVPRNVISIRHPEPPARPELAPVPEIAYFRTASR